VNELQPQSRFEQRTFRMNLIVRTEQPSFVENGWVGHELQCFREMMGGGDLATSWKESLSMGSGSERKRLSMEMALLLGFSDSHSKDTNQM
jgi:hypothetical protein